MIVLLGGGEMVVEAAAAAAATADTGVRTVDSAPEAADLLRGDDGADTLLVERTDVSDADALLADVRDGVFGDPRLPLVVRTATPLPETLPLLAYDQVLPADAGPDAIEDAVAEVLRVAAYREAVGDLYEQCRDRAADAETAPALTDLGPAREAADDALADLDPAALADLLWTPGDRTAREQFGDRDFPESGDDRA